jgi:hypothetical protein
MKLPRSVVIALWVASALLASNVLGYWWVTWPERTAREFAARISAKKMQEAADLVRLLPGVDLDYVLESATWRCEYTILQYGSRSAVDMLVGRREFQLEGTSKPIGGLCVCGSGSISPEYLSKLTAPSPTRFRFTTERGLVIQPFAFIGDSDMTVCDAPPRLEPAKAFRTSHHVSIESVSVTR